MRTVALSLSVPLALYLILYSLRRFRRPPISHANTSHVKQDEYRRQQTAAILAHVSSLDPDLTVSMTLLIDVIADKTGCMVWNSLSK